MIINREIPKVNLGKIKIKMFRTQVIFIKVKDTKD